ncbi:MAG: hypothetical protein WD512_20555 [Candidatus Paceibacterota bacterium]
MEEKLYFIFGAQACRAYNEEEDEDIIDELQNGGTLYEYDPNKETPIDLLNAYEGWDAFAQITKGEFDDFNNKLNEGS